MSPTESAGNTGATDDQFPFIGGHAALDFTNTVSGRQSDMPVDALDSYDDLVEWARLADLIDREFEPGLVAEAGGEAGRRRTLSRARRLREAAYEILTSLANGGPAPEDATRVLTREVKQASRHRGLTSSKTGFLWTWEDDRASRSLVCRIAWVIAELLTSDELVRLHVCDASGCSWMFLDTTRNHSRRWCDPKTCGNRVRVRRHYWRHRGASRQSGPR